MAAARRNHGDASSLARGRRGGAWRARRREARSTAREAGDPAPRWPDPVLPRPDLAARCRATAPSWARSAAAEGRWRRQQRRSEGRTATTAAEGGPCFDDDSGARAALRWWRCSSRAVLRRRRWREGRVPARGGLPPVGGVLLPLSARPGGVESELLRRWGATLLGNDNICSFSLGMLVLPVQAAAAVAVMARDMSASGVSEIESRRWLMPDGDDHSVRRHGVPGGVAAAGVVQAGPALKPI
uniref:Uncharacterized protein n=2 Tax=Oryza sativa subsp. japonica TaxID=39947 RepID=Q10GP7_ORYSJ|nr:hypothetical protein [Oryza sativa Japonica Group]ABF97654.1 expressed protein [Oryza sativa Japonica Group]